MSYQQQGPFGNVSPQGGGGYPQQGGYSPQTGYPQPGGYPAGPPPKKNNTAVIIAIVGVALAAVVAVVLVLVLNDDDDNTAKGGSGSNGKPGITVDTGAPGKPKDDGDDGGGGGTGSARALAEKAAKIMERHAVSEIDGIACASTSASKLKSKLERAAGVEFTATVEDVKETGDQATAKFKLTRASDQKVDTLSLEMAKRSGNWCLSGN